MPVVLLAFPLLALVALLVAYGFAQIQHGQSTGFLGWLESVAESALFLVSPLAEGALKLTSWLTHYLGMYFARTFHRGVQFFAGLNQYTKLVASIALTWPTELFRVSQWLVWHEIPRLIQSAVRGIAHEAHAAVTILKPVTKIVYRVPKISRAAALAALAAVLPVGFRTDLGLLRWLRHHFKALTKALAAAGAIATTVPRVIWKDYSVPFGRTIAQIKKRLRRLEGVTAGGLAVGAVAAVLTRMGVNWIRCNNVRRVGRGLCGSPGWLINLLTAGVVETFIISDLCRFSDLLIKQAEAIRPALLELVDVEDALIGCHGATKPGRLSLPPLSLPPMPAPSAFAA